MYIQQIVVDGFKSYSTRTVIGEFDPHFNAITGLNGSGKSNILDSICFVLGNNQNQQLRIQSIQELIYKQGQAGISKAAVELHFDNSDKNRSPFGYDTSDIIVVIRHLIVGGRNKYYINDKVETRNSVLNFFHSVQLNVNSGHFLIMQGKITKVINMKPLEIVDMIEEASGTKMYEKKRIEAQHNIKQKDEKLKEIDKIINENIEPMVKKLGADKENVLLFMESQNKIHTLSRLIHAYDYFNLIKEKELLNKNKTLKYEEIKADEEKVNNKNIYIENLKKVLNDFNKKIDKSKTDKDSKKINNNNNNNNNEEENEERIRRELTEKETEISLLHKNKKEIEMLKQKNNNAIIQLESKLVLGTLDKEYHKEYKELEEELENCLSEIDILYQQFESFNSGAKSGENQSLDNKVHSDRNQLRVVRSRIEALSIQHKSLKRELSSIKILDNNNNNNNNKEYDLLLNDYKKYQLEYEIYSKSPSITSFGSEEIKMYENIRFDISSKERALDNMIRESSDIRNNINQGNRYIASLIINSERKDSIFGPVLQHIRILPQYTKYVKAIQVAAGSRLRHVLVSDPDVAIDLIKKGHLKSRMNLVPLSKLKSKRVDKRRRDAINNLNNNINNINNNNNNNNKILFARDMVSLDLTKYVDSAYAKMTDDQTEIALDYIFGVLCITETSEDAKLVAFSEDRDIRSVTLNIHGDVFDPSGSLTGGSLSMPREQNSLLEGAIKLYELKHLIPEYEKSLSLMNVELIRLMNLKKVHTLNSQELSKISENISSLEESMNNSTYHKDKIKLEHVNREITNVESEIEISKESEKVFLEEIEKIEFKLNLILDLNSRESAINNINININNKKKKKILISQKIKEHKEMIETKEMEYETAESDKNAYLDNNINLSNDLDNNNKRIECLLEEVQNLKVKYNECISLTQITRNKETELLMFVSNTSLDINKMEEESTEIGRSLHRSRAELGRLASTFDLLNQKNKELINKYRFLELEKENFNIPNSEFDFRNININKKREELSTVELEHKKVGKNINKKSLTLYEHISIKYNALTHKRNILREEKAKIEEAIDILNHKKALTLTKTIRIVNHSFGSIFRCLLPDVDCMLSPPEGMTSLEGLEIKVKLVNTWKESLTELSGGQKSLIALSLLLALLRFKPCPMYILDEVDAALDVGHTTNIGRMIKQYFPNSQFIIVSLKEGMFNNASTLFRTRFEGGCSCITRIVQGGANEIKSQEIEINKTKSKKARKK